MKASFVREHGDPEALIYGDMPDPVPGPHDVLIRVRACSMNRVDVYTREGSHGMRPPLPRVLGRDLAGEVVAVGEHVRGFTPGQRVLALASSGSYAELAVADVADTWPMPDNLSFEEAATFPTVLTTAWHMLICTARLRLGEEVLIMAAGSGVGCVAIQLAKRSGARVFTTVSSDEKAEKALALGADVTINHTKEDFAARVLELTGGQGVSLVLEHVGAAVWEKCFRSLRLGGRLVTCGVTTGHRVELHLGQLWTREISLLGTRMKPREDMATILPVVARGEVRAVVSQVFPLQEAAEAHRAMEANRFFGKIVLVP